MVKRKFHFVLRKSPFIMSDDAFDDTVDEGLDAFSSSFSTSLKLKNGKKCFEISRIFCSKNSNIGNYLEISNI